MSVYFTSDLHLGHEKVVELRGFDSVKAHDEAVMDSLRVLHKRDKLFVVGDVCFSPASEYLLADLPVNSVLIFGNHDKMKSYAYSYFAKVHGCMKYKGFWLTHIPIHPYEMRRGIGNIHGHVHKEGDTQPITDKRYINVNWDFHRGPVSFDAIKAMVES